MNSNIDIKTLTDEEIVKIVINKDINVFEEIIRRYHSKLSVYVKRLIFATKEEIEDIVQDIFILAYKNINSFNFKFKFSTWIYRIAHNYAINYSKKHKNRQNIYYESDFNNLGNLIVSDLDFKDDIEKEFAKKELVNALYKLDVKYRSVLILQYFEDKSYEEISDILKIPRNTVGTLINRGKKQLKNILGDSLFK